MSSNFDATEFIDGDFQSRPSMHTSASNSPTPFRRPPTREEVDSRVTEAQQKLLELRQAQEALERERAALEETRRRQLEFQNGRQEMLQHLNRGIGLLEEAQFGARREAEQMERTVVAFRDALGKIDSLKEETWTQETFQAELTKALTVIENARMEWNSARLKFDLLTGQAASAKAAGVMPSKATQESLLNCSFGKLCGIGLALTWPIAVVLVFMLGIALFVLLQLRH